MTKFTRFVQLLNLLKIIKLTRWIFIFLCLLSLLTLTTPLTFEHVWLRNTVYLLTVALSFLVSREVKDRFLKNFIKWLPLLVFVFLFFSSIFSFSDLVTDGWRTVWISHRNINFKSTYIARQMLDVGARGYADRIVKVTPITPVFSWVTPVDTIGLDDSWLRVNEDFNPFNWKY